MRNEFIPEDREKLLAMLAKVAVIHHQLTEMEQELDFNTDVFSAISNTSMKAYDLKTALHNHLID